MEEAIKVRDKKANTVNEQDNPLGYEKESKLLVGFAIPCIISMLVTALYNIVDQIFIGQGVGMLGNAATNIAFPLSTSCTAISLLLGIGSATNFSLKLGAGEEKESAEYAGNGICLMAIFGIALFAVTTIFLTPMLKFFGATSEVLPYAQEYTRITAIGFPFLILSAGGGHLVRADGSPKMTMAINIVGAVVNTILDALFVFGFRWGMTGAAAATVIGQVVAAAMVVWYLYHYKTVQLQKNAFSLDKEVVLQVMSLGAAPCFNQLAMMLVQVVMNRTLKYYGGLSAYGESIPIACSGIIAKVSMLVMSFVIGISQGLQPIVSYNYGAKKYERVKKAYFLAIRSAAVICVVSSVLFQVFPRQIISVFGNGSELYFDFGENFFRKFLFFMFLCFMQPISANFFTAIGKPKKGIFMSLTRQIIFLLPLLLILPLFMGIDGVMYAGPVADLVATVVCTVLVVKEMRRPEFIGK